MNLQIRWSIRRDMPEILDIERRSFGSYAWDEETFAHVFRQRNCIGMVAEDLDRDRIVGFMVYEFHRKNLNVLNFAVHPEERRRGVGSAMAYKLVTKLSPQRRTHITLAVRDSNLDAHLFWRACGFQAVDVLRGYYDDTSDDAYVFRFGCREGVEA